MFKLYQKWKADICLRYFSEKPTKSIYCLYDTKRLIIKLLNELFNNLSVYQLFNNCIITLLI